MQLGINWLKIFTLYSITLLASCSTLVTISPNQAQQLSNLQIARVSTPPLIRNTWSESYVRAFPNALLPHIIYDNSKKEIGLLPPDIPDFGTILSKEILEQFSKKTWWPESNILSSPVKDISGLTPGNYLIIEFEDMRISGLGQLFTTVRVKLINKNNQILWDKRAGYNGLYSSEGDSLDVRLLKGQADTEQEFTHAAKYIVRDLLESLPK